jgi:hypothetical protein
MIRVLPSSVFVFVLLENDLIVINVLPFKVWKALPKPGASAAQCFPKNPNFHSVALHRISPVDPCGNTQFSLYQHNIAVCLAFGLSFITCPCLSCIPIYVTIPISL